MKRFFITFEGIEGSGKSTQVARLATYLEKKGYSVVSTREPGDSSIGKEIRSLLLNAGDVAPKAEFFLYLADRAQHLKEIILPALESGKVVLCDRFTDSTLIYQGYARGLKFSEMLSLLSFAAEGVIPDRTFLFDLPVEEGLSRVQKRAEINRLDCEAKTFHQKVRDGYLALADQGPKRICLIDANQTEEIVFTTIQKEIDALFQ